MTVYRPIQDYAIIGDTHSAALISSNGSLDWACLPHFNIGAVFLRILDDEIGGYCAVQPRNVKNTSRRYLPDTNILVTTFETGTGVLQVTDFMPVRRRPAVLEMLLRDCTHEEMSKALKINHPVLQKDILAIYQHHNIKGQPHHSRRQLAQKLGIVPSILCQIVEIIERLLGQKPLSRRRVRQHEHQPAPDGG